MVRDPQVAELVDDDVVGHLERRQHEPPVEGERAARRAGAPSSPLVPDPDPPVGDADPPCLVLRQPGDEPPGSVAPFRLAHLEAFQPEAWYLAAPLLLDPAAL